MKIAVIGAGGFIGSRLIERLHLGGLAEVVAVVRQPSSLARPARFALETRLADALDPRALTRALSGCTAVMHVALGDPAQIERMPAALCTAAAAAGIRRVIYLSSASVHGQNPQPGTDEHTPLRTGQMLDYNNAKVRAERRFFAGCRRHRLPGFALRPGIVYGPRSRWITELAAELIEGRAWLYRQGRAVCNAIYVDNLIDAMNACLIAPSHAAGAFFVGDAERVTWADFYRRAAFHLNCPWAGIHEVDQLPMFRRSWQDRGQRAAAHPLLRRLLPWLPGSLKRSTKAVLAASSPAPRAESWRLPSGPQPHLTQEMALLQQCAWKFPHRKAERLLGYQPGTTFADGMDASFAWWRFTRGECSAAA